MKTPIVDLASLLHPFSLGEFLADYWEREPLVIRRGDPRYYQDLMTDQDLEDLISDPGTRHPTIGLAKDGRFYRPEIYSSDVQVGQCLFSGVLDVNRISEEYAKGATITLPALHRIWKPLNALSVHLEQELDHRIHANAYLTPGRTAGFKPHYDTTGILVLQLAGRKLWQIREPPLRLPHADQPFRPEGFNPGPVLMDVELEPGDLLHLPRGYVHSTTTSKEHSAHVTIGINVYTWVDIVRGLIPSALDSEELRKALPPGFASRVELRPALMERLNQILSRASAADSGRRLFDSLLRQVASEKQRAPVRFSADVTVISPELPLQVASRQDYNLTPGAGDQMVLDFRGKKYAFPGPVAPTLGAMCTRTRFRLLDLPQGLDTDELLRLARFLQLIGFLRADSA
jgi:ribosomal protein L16 Arg81 hydroxylase